MFLRELLIHLLFVEYLLKYFYIKNFTSPEIKNRLDPVARVMEIWEKKLKAEDINIYFQFLKKIEEKMGKIISDEGFEALIFYLLIIK